ncbi:MAG: hypothetical protein ACYCU0_16000 [Solirubrobacteraceae bacterium]
MALATVSLYEVILAVHIMAVVIAFGVTFAYPVIFAVGAKHGPRSLPLLHRVEYTVERWLVNPGLLLVVAAGVFLASDGHHWKSFFVQWGIGAALVIGGLVGAVMIPTSQKAEEVARRDIEEHDSAGASGASAVVFSEEYRGLVRRLALVGSSLSALVLVTILFMALKL